jgi:hypothetical protein
MARSFLGFLFRPINDLGTTYCTSPQQLSSSICFALLPHVREDEHKTSGLLHVRILRRCGAALFLCASRNSNRGLKIRDLVGSSGHPSPYHQNHGHVLCTRWLSGKTYHLKSMRNWLYHTSYFILHSYLITLPMARRTHFCTT